MQGPIYEDQNTESIDLVKYLYLFWHWAWLILLAAIIAGVTAYFISRIIPPVYHGKTTVLVDMAPSNQSIDYSSLQLSSQLTQTYSQMMTKSPVLEEVAKQLGLVEVDPKSIIIKPVSNTQLISIIAESKSPQLAANIANTIVSVFADQVKSLQTTRFSDSEQSLQAQMTDIQAKIKSANDQLAVTTDPTEKDRLEAMVANYSQTYSGLLQSFEQVRLAEAQTQSSIVQIEPAIVPDKAVRPRILLNVAVAVVVSAVLAGGVIIAVDLFNNTVKTPDEITNKLGIPVLGVISHHSNSDNMLITETQPLSPISEAYRILRTNIKYAGAGLEKPLRCILVTSAEPDEGKTEVVVNLGIVLAQNRAQVLLMDADLRRPALHRRLGLDNLVGISQIFVHPELDIGYSLQPTRINGVTAITSGDTPPNPSELLGSQLMGTIMEKLKNNYDIVLIDTPPALAVTDAAVLLPYVEGVLLVIKPGITNLATLRRLVNQLRQLNGHLLGAVLNDINLKNSSYSYYYRQYKYYDGYISNDGNKPVKKRIGVRDIHGYRSKINKDLYHQLKK
jgi:succinoglycan biosynthesis transport protein ExoP